MENSVSRFSSWAKRWGLLLVVIAGCSSSNSPRAIYTVTATGTNVTITSSAIQTVLSGATGLFTVTPNSNLTVSNGVGGTCAIGTWSTAGYTTGAISGNCTVTFSTAPQAQWAKSATVGSGGSYYYGTATDTQGNVLSAGIIFSGSYSFGTGVTAAGSNVDGNLVMVKYSIGGVALWAQTATGTGESGFSAVATDSNNNVYGFGTFGGSSTFDFGNSVTADGSANAGVLIVKYNSNGAAQWAATLASGPASSGFSGGTVDSNGNIYAVGNTNAAGTYNFGNGVSVTTPGSNSANLLLVKYNSSGVAQWAVTDTANPSGMQFNSLAIDGSGNLFVGGTINGTGTYGFGNGVSATGTNTTGDALNWVVVKYNSSGVAQWAQTVSAGPNNSSVNSVVADGAGNCYAGGFVDTGNYSFGGVTVAGSSNGAMALVKYNASGVVQWAQTIGTTGGSNLMGLALDSSGNTYAAGNFVSTASVDFGNDVTVPAATSGTAFLAQYSPAGLAAWVNPQSSGTAATFYSVVLNPSGSPIVVGSINGTNSVGFGNSVAATGPASGNNAVVVQY